MGYLRTAVSVNRWTMAAALLVSVSFCLSVQAQNSISGSRPSTERHIKDKLAAKSVGIKTAGTENSSFTIEKIPSWVHPLSVDASVVAPAAPVQMMLIDRQTRVGNTATSHYMHFIRQVNDAAGLQKGAQIEIEFDPTYQKLVLHQLELWRGMQRVDKLDRKLVKVLHRETQLENQVIDGRMTAAIVIDDLRVGDRIEWSVSLVGDNPVFEGRFVDTEWGSTSSGPVGLLQVRLLTPTERNIHYRVTEPAIKVETEIQNGWRETRFRRNAVPQFHYDENVPPSSYLKDQIEFSEFADWAEVANWADKLFSTAVHPSAAIDAQVAAIQARTNAQEEQLRAALDFVQQDVRYFGTEIGPYSHLPAAADTVLRQRFGDCKDKVVLLSTLLQRLGFEVSPVLVSARYRAQVSERLPSPLAFDHAIIGVNVNGHMIWLDSTRSQQSGMPISRQPVGLGYGLLARTGTVALTALPSMRNTLRAETVDTFSFQKLAQEGTLESVTTYYGDIAEWIRSLASALPASDFERMVTGEVMRIYPNFVLTAPPQVEKSKDLNAVTITAHYRTGNFWRFPDQRILVGDFALISLMNPLRLPERISRTEPMRINMPGVYRHKVKFSFSEDVYSQPNSSRFDESNSHFELHMQYESKTREQVIKGELNQLAEVIEVTEATRYREQLTKVWPRLANNINVPAISPSQGDAVRTEIAALSDAIRRGDLKVPTREQFAARARLIVLNKQLTAERLPQNLRAEALVAKGIQLDHLGRADEAKLALYSALEIDKGNAEALDALAVNALLRRQNDEAIDIAAQALQLAPSKISPRYTRAYARYFSGDWPKARDEFQGILQSQSEVERSYATIWLYLATRRLGEDAKVAVASYVPMASKPVWPHAIMQFMNGQLDFDSTLAATRENGQPDKGRECEFYFYAAEKALLDSDVDKARNFLRKSIATDVVEFNEHAMARLELDRIGAR